jgi:Ca-activated chloride channel homolog
MKHHPCTYALCMISVLCAFNAHAFSIRPWFENINQQAARLMHEKKFAEAEKKFTQPDWKAVAAYRNQNYATAGTYFKTRGGTEGFYNQGNALAYQEKYQEAIQAYDKTLKLNPHHDDAKHNRDLLKKLLENQPPQSSNQDKNKQEQDQDKKQEQDQKQDKREQEQEQNQDQKQDKQEQEEKQESAKQPEEQKTKPKEDNPEKEQWLRLIPDDPGGLLREKFWRDHYRRKQEENA